MMCRADNAAMPTSINKLEASESCREKLSMCGTFEQGLDITFLLLDHSSNESHPSELTYEILIGSDTTLNGTAVSQNRNEYMIRILAQYLGTHILVIYNGGKQIPNSPFRFLVTLRNCQNASGLVPDLEGNCVCPSGMDFEIRGTCVSLSIFLPAIILPTMFIIGIVTVWVFQSSIAKEGDASWNIKETEIVYPEETHFLGVGSSGPVLKASYRGTPVAIKRFKCYTENHGEAFNVSSRWSIKMTNRQQVSPASHSSQRSPASDALRKRTFNQLRDDLKILTRLRHPCLTTVMGGIVIKVRQYKEIHMVMELMEIGSMWDLLHNETYPLVPAIALRFLQDISKGMQFLHGANPPCLHGDLKSANILIDHNFSAKISDFGMSVNMQTSFWAAPECLSGEPVSAQADVYSFGVIIYEVLSRSEPYNGEEWSEIVQEVCAGRKRLPVPAGCSAEVLVLMNECLLHDSRQRPMFSELNRRLNAMDEHLMTSSALAPSQESLGTQSMQIVRELFPPAVAEALVKGEKIPPEHKENITMYFSDIVGFTTISTLITPEKVNGMLDRLYHKLDAIAERLKVYKVETIGDAYLCAANVILDQSESHALIMAKFAVAAQKAANETLIDEDQPSRGSVRIRVGLSSGPCIASVVGKKNPKYTLFGDTINTASRMESTSVPGFIQCSQKTADLIAIQDVDRVVRVELRGLLQVKGKGEMTTYWILCPGQEPPAAEPAEAGHKNV